MPWVFWLSIHHTLPTPNITDKAKLPRLLKCSSCNKGTFEEREGMTDNQLVMSVNTSESKYSQAHTGRKATKG